jgi:uncharacterized membrane-anchored protein
MHRYHRPSTLVCALAVILFAMHTAAAEQDNDLLNQANALRWRHAPSIVPIGNEAEFRLTGDLRYLDADNTSKFLELNGNLPSQGAYVVAPNSYRWFAVFQFEDIGYVRDDEHLDADALLNSLKEQGQQEDEERKRRGLPALRLVGWFVKPHYDSDTHYLEWGTKLVSDDGDTTVNYSIRILGRMGVMDAIVVSGPETLSQDVSAFKRALAGFSFISGHQYQEFRSGDKVAEYGLGALVLGGAAAAIAKTGAGKVIIKFLAIGVFAIGATISGVIRRLFRRST